MRLAGAAIVLLATVSLAAPSARAQLFSPGALSKSHKALDGISGCTKCHSEGSGHDNNKCLECHAEIKKRQSGDLGYHRTVKAQLCADCHREHRGVGASLVDWSPSRDSFNHVLTGWPLKGAHKKPKCMDCHEARRVADDDARELLSKGRTSFLGVTTRCVRCHADEHRTQEGEDCEKCHTTDGDFKSAALFEHNNRAFAQYALTGKHRTVACKSCHDVIVDTKPAAAFPSRRSEYFLQMKDVPHASCTACHDDPHNGNFGTSCTRCHTPEGWKIIKDTAQDTGFHDKHRFQLRGEHTSVACKTCHGPSPGRPAIFRGLKFANCADCHADAHVGQIPAEDGVVKCEKCHTVAGFTPVFFDVTMHDKTRFPLQASHRAVACNACHKPDLKLREKFAADALKSELVKKGRKVIVSDARLAMPGVLADALAAGPTAAPSDCAGCHKDVHLGQFMKAAGDAPNPHVEKKACSVCHVESTFSDVTKFKHDDSRFPLTGKHTAVLCVDCHAPATKGRADVAYRPMNMACAACHADVHVGQLAKNGVTACDACHGTAGFKPAKFDHNKQSSFPLDGQHRLVACSKCHEVVDIKGRKIARYRPLPTACAECHEDEHKRGFDAFNPAPKPMADRLVEAVAVHVDPSGPAVEEPSRCEGCHVAAGWLPAKFAHERTGFALTGRHATTRCVACHRGGDLKRTVPTTCAGCHSDPHAQEFGLQCNACHSTDKFTGPAFPVDAHRRSAFPLTGRHAALPCDACHVEKRESGFSRAALDCVACHAKDAVKASLGTVDHTQPPFAGPSCGACHVPATFSPARFPQHDVCFPIGRGVHAPVKCIECHVNLVGARAQGKCDGLPVLCAQCHDHAADVEAARHKKVPGYEHKSEKCAACHRSP